jgi:hypothetical protein
MTDIISEDNTIEENVMEEELVETEDEEAEYGEDGIRMSIKTDTTDKYLLALHFMEQSKYITD